MGSLRSSEFAMQLLCSGTICGMRRLHLVDVSTDGTKKLQRHVLNVFGHRPSSALANLSAASFDGREFAPEQIVSAFGSYLATGTEAATTVLPTMLAGTKITITDSANTEHLAPLFFVSPQQINYVIPADVREGAATIAVINNGQDYKEVADHLGDIPVIGSGGEFARASRPMFTGESVLLGRKGTIDKPLYINGPFWAVDTMFYTLIDRRAEGRFVYYAATTIPFDFYSTNTALPRCGRATTAATGSSTARAKCSRPTSATWRTKRCRCSPGP